MFPSDHDVWARIVEERMRDRLQAAQTHRLMREAGIDQPGWLSRQTGRLLCHLGLLLVTLGRRLAHYEVPPPGLFENQEPGGEQIRVSLS